MELELLSLIYSKGTQKRKFLLGFELTTPDFRVLDHAILKKFKNSVRLLDSFLTVPQTLWNHEVVDSNQGLGSLLLLLLSFHTFLYQRVFPLGGESLYLCCGS